MNSVTVTPIYFLILRQTCSRLLSVSEKSLSLPSTKLPFFLISLHNTSSQSGMVWLFDEKSEKYFVKISKISVRRTVLRSSVSSEEIVPIAVILALNAANSPELRCTIGGSLTVFSVSDGNPFPRKVKICSAVSEVKVMFSIEKGFPLQLA